MCDPRFSREDLTKISNGDFTFISENAQELVNAIVTYSSSETCNACKDNLERSGVVCEKHYHDYQLCADRHCLRCILYHSFGIEYDETAKKLTSEELELYRSVSRIILQKRKEFLNGRPD